MHSVNVEHLSDTQTRIRCGTKTILILGTAHISTESLEEVRRTIKDEEPDHVCVEIDEARLKSLRDGESWSSLDLKKILKRKQEFLLMASLALASFQRRIGANIGVRPGGEMLAAVEAAESAGISYSCSDRSLQTTLNRAWRMSGFWTKLKLLSTLLASQISKESLSSKDIEELKKSDVLQGMMTELSASLPTVKNVLIDERDEYLASKIFESPGNSIVAVVGAGHVPGIVGILKELGEGLRTVDTDSLDVVPAKRWVGKLMPWIIPAIVLGLFVFGLLNSGLQKFLEMGLVWILANGIFAALGSLIAWAHPLTIVISFVAAPITSLNPTIGVGMVAGLLEYFFRNPRVADMEKLNVDIESFSGWYRNRVTHILLVFFFSSLGSAIGTFYAIPRITMLTGS